MSFPIEASEKAGITAFSILGSYLVLVAIGRLFKRRGGVRFGIGFQLFAICVAVFVPLHFEGINWVRGGFNLMRELGCAIAVLSVFVVVPLLRQYCWGLYFERGRRIQVPKFLQDLVALVLFAGAVVGVLAIGYGQTIPGLLAGSGIAAIVIGLALQDLLGNVIAGIALQISRPFRQGDWLMVDGQYAEVIEVNWRSTRVRNNDAITLDIPNSHIAKNTITNLNYPERNYAIRVRVGVEYGAPPAVVKDVLKAAAEGSLALSDPPPKVFLVDFADSAVIYEVKFWMHDHSRYNDTVDSVRTNIWYGLKRAGLTIPFPIRTLQRAPSGGGEFHPASRVRNKVLSAPFFACMGAEEGGALLAAARAVRFGAGEAMVRQGEPGQSMFVLLEGKARVDVTRDGVTHTLAQLGFGDCFGEISLLTGDPRGATVVAETDCAMMEIEKVTLAPYLERHPSLANSLAELLARRRCEMEAALSPSSGLAVEESKREEYAAGFLRKLTSFFEL